MAAAAEIAKPAQYGSLYRHIIWTSKHIRSPYRIFFCFYGCSNANSTRFRLFFCHLHDRCVLILECTGDGCFLTPPSPAYYNVRDLFGRLKRTGKTSVFCFDKDVFFSLHSKSAQGLLTLIIIFARRMIIYSFIFFNT